MQLHDVEGYEHIVSAAHVLSSSVSDLFLAPKSAQERANAVRERLGEEDHGDDLLCGCWSAAEAATALLELGGRHVDAVLHLAMQHPGFLPSAQVLSRAALEALLRCCWLLEPTEAADREQRWIALEREEQRFFDHLAKTVPGVERTDKDLDVLSEVVGGTVVVGVPSMETMASSFGRTPILYDYFYRWGSQSTHGTLVGSAPFNVESRKEWWAQGGKGEWVEAEFWTMPLIACWEGIASALPAYCNLLAPAHALPGLQRESEFIEHMQSAPINYQAKLSIARRHESEAPQLSRAQRRAAAKSKKHRTN
jgi:hypothetical protein